KACCAWLAKTRLRSTSASAEHADCFADADVERSLVFANHAQHALRVNFQLLACDCGPRSRVQIHYVLTEDHDRLACGNFAALPCRDRAPQPAALAIAANRRCLRGDQTCAHCEEKHPR